MLLSQSLPRLLENSHRRYAGVLRGRLFQQEGFQSGVVCMESTGACSSALHRGVDDEGSAPVAPMEERRILSKKVIYNQQGKLAQRIV